MKKTRMAAEMPTSSKLLLAAVAATVGISAVSARDVAFATSGATLPGSGFRRALCGARRGPAVGLRASSGAPDDKDSAAEKKATLKEIGESAGSQRVSRSTISPAEMLQMQREAAAADPEVASQRRRNIALAVMSPLVGVGLFGAKKNMNPMDEIDLMRAMEAKSVPIQEAMKNGKPTCIEFYTEWCKDCKAMAPLMTDFKRKYSNQINFVSLNAEREENAELVNLFRVDAIPHFAMVDNGTKLLTTLTGYFPEKIFTREFDALAAGIQLPYCGPDRCFLDENSGYTIKKGDRDTQ